MRRTRLNAVAAAVMAAVVFSACAQNSAPTPDPSPTVPGPLLVLDDRQYDDLEGVNDIGWEGSFEARNGCVAFRDRVGSLHVPIFPAGVSIKDFDSTDQSFTLDFAGYGTLRSGVSSEGYVSYRQDISEFKNGDHCLEAINPDDDSYVYIVTLGEDIPWWP